MEIARKVNIDFTVKPAEAFAQTLAPQLLEGKKFRFVLQWKARGQRVRDEEHVDV